MNGMTEYPLQVADDFTPPRARDSNPFRRGIQLAFPWRDPSHYVGRVHSAAYALRMPYGTVKTYSYSRKQQPSSQACDRLADWLEREVSAYQAMIVELRGYAKARREHTERRVPWFAEVGHWDGPDKPARDRRYRKPAKSDW